MERHFFGHASTHAPHWMQEKGSILHSPVFLSTVSAPEGQLLSHMPQRMHWLTSFTTRPRTPWQKVFGASGYSEVTGGLNKFATACLIYTR